MLFQMPSEKKSRNGKKDMVIKNSKWNNLMDIALKSNPNFSIYKANYNKQSVLQDLIKKKLKNGENVMQTPKTLTSNYPKKKMNISKQLKCMLKILNNREFLYNLNNKNWTCSSNNYKNPTWDYMLKTKNYMNLVLWKNNMNKFKFFITKELKN